MTNKKIKYKPVDPELAALAEKHGGSPEAILEMFQDLQGSQGSLQPEKVDGLARALNIPAEKAYGVASFYSMLRLDRLETAPKTGKTLHVCDGPVCWLKGAGALQQAAIEALGDAYTVERSSCLGLCDRAPAALVDGEQAGPLSPTDLHRLAAGWRGQAADYSSPRLGELRVMMAQAGQTDPDLLKSALDHGAYDGLKKALEIGPEAVLDTAEASGLAGRGGAGFPVGRKWRFVALADSQPKFIICNADESEPLIFKDRVLIDSNPHQILEGMAVAGLACGAEEAYIYIRGEYARQAERLERAIQQAEAAGYLGEHILGSDFSFHIHVHRGAGAYICGEETALIESLEGKRGEPRVRPPYPPSYGFRGQPTLVNNVESFAAVPAILRNGAEWYRSLSTARTPGTKMYMLLGHVTRPGLFEAPFGLTLRQVIEEFGGGMTPSSEFQFALTGGAAGTIVTADLLDVPIDYASTAQGVSLGAGAFLICDQSVPLVAFVRELLHFFTVESCGKCTPCRIGTKQALDILTRLAEQQGQPGDVHRLSELADTLQLASFCGLGQSVAIPLKSALQHFQPLFQAAETSK